MSSTYEMLAFATPDLSIVIPAHNEEGRIGRTLDSVADFLREQSLHAEVIVVDDGSTDRTSAVAEARHDDFVDLRVLRCERNGGKGRAVRLGMLVARGKLRLFMDADGATDIREFARLRATAARRATLPEVVIASMSESANGIERSVSRTRARLRRLRLSLVRRTVLPGIADAQRGFKLFTAEAADAVFSRARMDGWGFDIEVLAIARALGFHIVEVPVQGRHDATGRAGPSSYLTTIVDVARVRRSLRRTQRALRQDADARHRLWVG
jgi:dolichyl-phosphate beta-glucosyltransferase